MNKLTRTQEIEGWGWMMNYCKNQGYPPADAQCWNWAKSAYKNFLNERIVQKIEQATWAMVAYSERLNVQVNNGA